MCKAETSMTLALQRLTDACREHLVREKIVVAPSLAIGHQIADAIAQGGTSWVNLRIETVRSIADAVAGLDLAQRGLTVLSRAQALAFVERACDRALDESSYFAALAGRPGLHRAIQRSIDDLRHAGVAADAIVAEAFEDERKAADLAAVIRSYEAELAERKFVDRYGVIARAIGLLESGALTHKPWSDDAMWFVISDAELSSAEERLIRLASGGKFEKIGGEVAAERKGSTRFVRATGEENEIRAAFRALLGAGAPFDSAEIVYTARDPYLSLAYELAAEYEVPATFAEGIAVPYTRPGQACIGFLRWLADDCASVHLEQIARAGAITIPELYEPLTPFVFARILRNAQIGWGRDRYMPRLRAYIEVIESKLEEADSEPYRERLTNDLANARVALITAERFVDFASVIDGNAVDGSRLALAVAGFLEMFGISRNEFDGMALASLRRMLAELAELPSTELPLRVAVDRLIEAVEATYVGASNPRPGHLHVAPIRSGGWSGRLRIFAAGLDDAKHPGSGLQDPVVLDEERVAINAAITPGKLQLQGEGPVRVSEQFRRFVVRTTSAELTLSWSELDLRERRGRFPARDLLEVFRSVHGSNASYDDLLKGAARAGFLESASPLDETEWWLQQRFLLGRTDLKEMLLGACPWLAAGERAEAARDSEAITEWDGRINVPAAEIDPRCTGRTYSPSGLEKMASCPFGWFLDRVLGIRPVERIEKISEQWLDPRLFGSMMHDIFQRSMEALVERGEKPSFSAHRELFHRIALGEIAAQREEIPPATESVFVRQREEALDSCDVFLRTEEQRAEKIEPKYFEVVFGYDDAEEAPFGMTEPLEIPLKCGKLRVGGRIDRIDRNRNGSWEVWDYKTGSLWGFHERWRLKQGTKLQHAIYARAVDAMLEAQGIHEKVGSAGYYFPTPKGGGELSARQCGAGELETALNELFDTIGRGWFPVPDEGNCRFCEFDPICRSEKAKERVTRKLEANVNDPAVAAWLRLQEVE
jgi:RecB family exonuclease